MKILIIAITLILLSLNNILAQGTILIRGSCFMIDPANSFIVSLDSYIDSTGVCKTIYLDTLNFVDSKGMKQGSWIEYGVLCLPYFEFQKKDSIEYLDYPVCLNIRFWGKYVNNKRHGRWVAYHDNRSLWKDVTYKHGKVVGDFVVWYRDGTPRISGKQISSTHHKVTYFNYDGTVKKVRNEDSYSIDFDYGPY
jgi:hypothetical protein